MLEDHPKVHLMKLLHDESNWWLTPDLDLTFGVDAGAGTAYGRRTEMDGVKQRIFTVIVTQVATTACK